MNGILFCTQTVMDSLPQIIGVIGTLLGALLGWVLHLISDNREKIYIFVDKFENQKNVNDEYAYILRMFVYNDSRKYQCMRNVRLFFSICGQRDGFESIPHEGECKFENVRWKHEQKTTMLSVGSYAQNEYVLSDLVEGEDYKKLCDVNKIYMFYENKKNHTKRKLIKSDFKIENVDKCEGASFL